MLWLAFLIAAGALVSEDASTLSAAYLAAGGKMNVPLAFASAFLGIWIGDLGLYAGARFFRSAIHRSRFSHWLLRPAIQRAMRSLEHASAPALVLCRFVPGTRLPTYLGAGLIKMRPRRFAIITAGCAALWVALMFAIAQGSVSSTSAFGIRHQFSRIIAAIALGALSIWIAKRSLAHYSNRISAAWMRWSRWEFWPAWLFYPPVFLLCVHLGFKYRGFALPTIANPGQHNGGIVGESKIDILRQLRVIAPERTAEAHLIAPGHIHSRMEALQWAMEQEAWSLPIILKPDVAQRGAGFRKIDSLAEARDYLARVPAPVIAQRYIAGPHEAGIFYYRFPSQERGNIFAITEKQFPTLIGDGVSTLRELIANDARARLIAGVYLKRHAPLADRVVPSGEQVRLVEAGNHCQGCIFKDGSHLYTPELEAAIDEILRTLPEFYVGRLDVRFSEVAAFRRGKDFSILELNGAASEATNIYDERNSLWSAYATLFRQWELVYRIGAANRDRGFRPATASRVLVDWLAHRRIARLYPAAD